jgi:hypothetical protein
MEAVVLATCNCHLGRTARHTRHAIQPLAHCAAYNRKFDSLHEEGRSDKPGELRYVVRKCRITKRCTDVYRVYWVSNKMAL